MSRTEASRRERADSSAGRSTRRHLQRAEVRQLLVDAAAVSARLAGSRPGVALLHAAAVGAIGGVLIALKAVLH